VAWDQERGLLATRLVRGRWRVLGAGGAFGRVTWWGLPWRLGERGNVPTMYIQLLTSWPNSDQQHLGHTPFSSNSTPFGDLELVRDVKVVVDLDDDPDRPKVVGVQVIGMDFPDFTASRKGVVDDIAIRRFGGKSIDTGRASHTGT
jgi:hypothetical protein